MKYIRNDVAVKATLIKIGNSVTTTTGCKIVFPERYVERGLAILSIENYVYGIFALILPDDQYSVCNINAMIRVLPNRIEKIKIENTAYYQLSFEPNTVVIANTMLIKDKMLINNVFDELVFKGKIPWYLNYIDLGKLFDTSVKHADSLVNKNLAIIELLISILARDPKNPNIFYRTIADNNKEMPVFLSLNNVYYATAGTLNKLAGAYFSDGVISALVKPSEEVSKLERILRS